MVLKATGGLLRHVKACFGVDEWTRCRLSSANSKLRAGKDGELIETYPFKVLMPHHARFVIFCFRTWDHFQRTRSDDFLTFVRGWDQQAALPEHRTCFLVRDDLGFDGIEGGQKNASPSRMPVE